MEKRYGASGPQDGLYKIGRNKWDVFYGFGKDAEDADHGYNWYQRFTRRPSIEELKAIIIGQIEAHYAAMMLAGFEWNGMRVEYTEERKNDFTGLLVGLQGGILQLPLTLNLGKGADGSPQLYTFSDAAEIGAVAGLLAAHKSSIAAAEWAAKMNVDWGLYETEQE